MRKKITLFTFFLGFATHIFGQCTPDPVFTLSPIPGVYPPNIPIPGIPLVGINEGQINTQYDQTLTLIVLEDTSLDVTTLDPTLSTILALAGINPVMSLDVNQATFDVQGLSTIPLTYDCDQSNCEYASGMNGCIKIQGIPTQSGTFPVDVNMTINVQIPAIIDPILGTTLYAGGPIDMPTFPAQQYDLLINSTTETINHSAIQNILFPNPTSTFSTLTLERLSKVEIYNVLGKRIKYDENKKGVVHLTSEELGKGIFYIIISSDQNTITKKLIIK